MHTLAQNLVTILQDKGLTITTAESCTGGLLSSLITEISGASSVFNQGYTTYANQAKQDLLNVPLETLETHGAVSPQTATAMAQGALKNANADIALSITGIAGPTGGTTEKPIGTVHIGIATQNGANSVHHQFKGTRTEIREQSCEAALQQAIETLEQ